MITIENFAINAVETSITAAIASSNFYIAKADIEENMEFHIINALRDIEYSIDGNTGTTSGLFIKSTDGSVEGVLTRSNFKWSSGKRATDKTTKIKCIESDYSKRDDRYSFTFEALD